MLSFKKTMLLTAGVASLAPAFLALPHATAETDDQRVRGFAARAAHAGGDDNPSALHWVRTTRAAANRELAGAVADDSDSSRDVFVIQQHGHFTARYASVPDGSALPTGSVMTLVVDSTSGNLTDYGLSSNDKDLSSLGDVHDDSQ